MRKLIRHRTNLSSRARYLANITNPSDGNSNHIRVLESGSRDPGSTTVDIAEIDKKVGILGLAVYGILEREDSCSKSLLLRNFDGSSAAGAGPGYVGCV